MHTRGRGDETGSPKADQNLFKAFWDRFGDHDSKADEVFSVDLGQGLKDFYVPQDRSVPAPLKRPSGVGRSW